MIGRMRFSRYLRVQKAWSLAAVALLRRDLEHRRADGGEADARRRRVVGLGHEVRRHQGEAVVLALVVELAVALPRRPDRAHRLDVFAHARRRRRPRHREALLVVRPDLRAEPQREAAAGAGGEIPADVGRDHRRAREGDRHAGVQLDLLRRDAGNGEREERIVPVLLRADAGIAVGLDLLRGRADLAKILLGQRGEDAHASAIACGARLRQTRRSGRAVARHCHGKRAVWHGRYRHLSAASRRSLRRLTT